MGSWEKHKVAVYRGAKGSANHRLLIRLKIAEGVDGEANFFAGNSVSDPLRDATRVGPPSTAGTSGGYLLQRTGRRELNVGPAVGLEVLGNEVRHVICGLALSIAHLAEPRRVAFVGDGQAGR